jgi:Zn-dependent M32 family carboxypeptidase
LGALPGDADQPAAGRPEAGRYLQERVFRPGSTWPWPQFVQHATGEPLTAKYFAAEVK